MHRRNLTINYLWCSIPESVLIPNPERNLNCAPFPEIEPGRQLSASVTQRRNLDIKVKFSIFVFCSYVELFYWGSWSDFCCKKGFMGIVGLRWLWNVVSYIKGRMQANSIWKKGPWDKYFGSRGMKMGSGEGSTMRSFIICTVLLI